MRLDIARTTRVLALLVVATLLTPLAPGCATNGPDDGDGANGAPRVDSGAVRVDRVTTVVPFPRGLVLRNGQLFVLARGRVRGAGGVANDIDDRAGTIYVVDPTVSQPISEPQASEAVRRNGRIFAAPTDPPFRLYDRASPTPQSDTRTDRPYCTLRWHDGSQSFYLCAFSGIDLSGTPSFSKNHTDALLRYDTRTGGWYEVDRHAAAAGDRYPHHDPATSAPPHGWLKGPDNCLVVGDWLYAVAKDNDALAVYDLAPLAADPGAAPPVGRVLLGERIAIRTADGFVREQVFWGHSMLARHGQWLYLGFRTTSEIIRLPLGADGLPVQPIVAEMIARFEPWDPATGRSANLTDMDVDAEGRLYVVSAQPSRIWRVSPDPARVYDARDPHRRPWVDLAARTGNPKMKSENVLVDRTTGRVFVTAGDAYGQGYGLGGAVYVVTASE